ncbi:hypothetical protein SLH49_22255, partial [Cognatiyoonia sp. IB215446]|nr:hypothetical protein [Cognatiyoonia sp. IB215446]
MRFLKRVARSDLHISVIPYKYGQEISAICDLRLRHKGNFNMLSVATVAEPIKAKRPAAFLPGKWRGVLNALRVVALDCRAAARTDLFEACALISNKQNQAQDAFAQALFKCISDVVGNKPVFFRPGTVELSF